MGTGAIEWTPARTRADLTERGRASALRLAELVRSLDPADAARPVPGLEWSVAETAAHVVNLYGRGLGDRRRSDSPGETAALNAECLAEYREREPAVIADRIAADAVTVWDDMLPLLPDDLAVPFHAGVRTTVVPIMGVLLLEMLVHGRDIADATGRTWGIDELDAWSALTAVAPLLPAWRRFDAADDTIAIPGPSGDALRITCGPEAVEVARGPVEATDRVVHAAPSSAILGIVGRRTDDPLLAELARRFGPF